MIFTLQHKGMTMHKHIKIALMLIVWGLTTACYALSPVGTWLTIDDKTGKPRSTIVITEQNNELVGQLINVIKMPGDTGICSRCPGQFKDQKIQGLQILWDLKKKSDNEYVDGQILDPKSGKIYNCILKLSEDGKSLRLRGYIGIALFGRTQTWTRVPQ